MTKQQESNLILIKIAGWTFAVGGLPDEEERVRDIDLAERLEYKVPRQIRRLIKAMIERGELTDIYWRTVPVHQLVNGGGSREEMVTEYWLTEAQALKVSARSGTHIASKILDHIIKVFLAVRDEYRAKEVAAAPAPPLFMSETQAQAELLKARRAYHEDAMLHIVDLEATGKITRETAIAHRTQLLQQAGIDLTKAPVVVYENVAPVQPVSEGTVPVTKEDPISGRPVVGVHVMPVADLNGFYSARRIAGTFEGVSDVLVGNLARGVGIFEKETNILNEYGCKVPVVRNAAVLNNNWAYSEKSKAILLTLIQKYLDIRRTYPKKVTQAAIVAQVSADWLAGQAPASPPPVQH